MVEPIAETKQESPADLINSYLSHKVEKFNGAKKRIEAHPDWAFLGEDIASAKSLDQLLKCQQGFKAGNKDSFSPIGTFIQNDINEIVRSKNDVEKKLETGFPDDDKHATLQERVREGEQVLKSMVEGTDPEVRNYVEKRLNEDKAQLGYTQRTTNTALLGEINSHLLSLQRAQGALQTLSR